VYNPIIVDYMQTEFYQKYGVRFGAATHET
jgi:hypothetical protein